MSVADPADLGPVDLGPIGPPRGRIRLRTLVLIRWVAVVGQATALLVVDVGLGYALPIWWALAVVGASAALNIWASTGRRLSAQLADREAALYLGYDLLQLAALLYLTGGLNNPFAILILAPVTVSATILSRRSTIGLSLLAVAVVAVLAVAHMPLPWPDGSFALQPLFILGLALALGLSALFVAAYVFSVSEEARRMSDALAATQMALDREQRLSALGALAAAAAHELGSPLGTIAVVAKELARDLPPDSPLGDDVALLLSQSARCREILAQLAARPEADGGTPFDRLSPAALVERAAAAHRPSRIRLIIQETADGPDGAARPTMPASPEILHGLGNLLQNAFEFARSEVRATVRWDDRRLTMTIADDGPGFDPGLLDRLGEPYLSGGAQGREGKDVPMGLGLFIAQTLLGRTGGALRLGNRRGDGAEVAITWQRAALEPGYSAEPLAMRANRA